MLQCLRCYFLWGLTCVADSCCWWLQPGTVLQCLRCYFVRFNMCSWQLLMASAKCCAPVSEMLFVRGLTCVADSCCCWWLQPGAVLQCLRCYFVRFNMSSWQLLMASAKCCASISEMLFVRGLRCVADSCCWWLQLSAVLQCLRCYFVRFNMCGWQLLMASAKCCAPTCEMSLYVRFNMCSWQLLLLMALAKCCAPIFEMLFSVRFNVCSWQLLLMASAKCCASMCEMLFALRFNVCSWQLLLLMASDKYFAASSVNWFLVRFNQLSWDSLHFNNLQISKQPNRPMLL